MSAVILEGRVPAGGAVTFEARAGEDFDPAVLNVLVREPGDPDFVIPLHVFKSQQDVRAHGLYITGAWLNDHPLMNCEIPAGGLMMVLFEPNGGGAQAGYYNVCAGDRVILSVRSERGRDVDLRMILAAERGEEPKAAPFPALDPAWGRWKKPEGHHREYIHGMPSTPFAVDETREVAFRGFDGREQSNATFRAVRLVIPSAVGEHFEILDVKVDGESRLGGGLAKPQPCITFAEWTVVGHIDLGIVPRGSRITMVVRRTGGPGAVANFTGALIGPVEE